MEQDAKSVAATTILETRTVYRSIDDHDFRADASNGFIAKCYDARSYVERPSDNFQSHSRFIQEKDFHQINKSIRNLPFRQVLPLSTYLKFALTAYLKVGLVLFLRP